MITKISAEFESIDAAEATARIIKHHAENVIRIEISGTLPSAQNDYNQNIYDNPATLVPVNTTLADAAGINMGTGINNFTGIFPVLPVLIQKASEPAYNDIRNTSAYLSVICQKSSQRAVEQFMLSNGGQRIHEG